MSADADPDAQSLATGFRRGLMAMKMAWIFVAGICLASVGCATADKATSLQITDLGSGDPTEWKITRCTQAICDVDIKFDPPTVPGGDCDFGPTTMLVRVHDQPKVSSYFETRSIRWTVSATGGAKAKFGWNSSRGSQVAGIRIRDSVLANDDANDDDSTTLSRSFDPLSPAYGDVQAVTSIPAGALRRRVYFYRIFVEWQPAGSSTSAPWFACQRHGPMIFNNG